MRYVFIAILGFALFALYAVWDKPSAEEQALAQKAAESIASRYGNLPFQTGTKQTTEEKTYAFRAARHGLVIFVAYGITSEGDRARLRAGVQQAIVEVPGLEAVSIEWYEAYRPDDKARMIAREMLQRSQSTYHR
jgi:hypothetical protein